MSVREVTFVVKLPIDKVWSHIADREEMGSMFPGCTGVKILNASDSIWTVRMTLGPFSRTLDIVTHNTEFKKQKKIAWDASADQFRSRGSITLRKISAKETEITYKIEAHAIGHFSLIQELIAANRLGEVTNQFIHNMKKHLEWRAEDEQFANAKSKRI